MRQHLDDNQAVIGSTGTGNTDPSCPHTTHTRKRAVRIGIAIAIEEEEQDSEQPAGYDHEQSRMKTGPSKEYQAIYVLSITTGHSSEDGISIVGLLLLLLLPLLLLMRLPMLRGKERGVPQRCCRCA